MGVDLSPIVEKREITLESLASKKIAIDAHNVLYQFLASIRQPDGTPLMDFSGNITSHLSGLLYRTERLMENGIKVVYVFDGKPPAFKEKTIEKRRKAKEEAKEKWEKALALEEEGAKTYAQATSKLTDEMIAESMELISAMGIPYIQAPEEGEAQAACMAKKGIVYASASQDYDSLLFGSPLLIRNLSITGKRKLPRRDQYTLIYPEQISLSELLSANSITQEQLILIGILVGTDFNEGVKGVGPKTALKIVQEQKTFENVLRFVKNKYAHEFEPYIEEVFEYFLNPPCIDAELRWGKPNAEKIIEILVEKHDFSEERVRNAIEKMVKGMEEKGGQEKISKWF
ncbi:MAG: flap endonuclease-1 [Candidatus Anstonellales archaeon]